MPIGAQPNSKRRVAPCTAAGLTCGDGETGPAAHVTHALARAGAVDIWLCPNSPQFQQPGRAYLASRIGRVLISVRG